MTTRFLPLADKELEADAKWYEQRLPGLGREFILAVRETVKEITRDPTRFETESPPQRHRTLHRARVERFPYDVIFEVRPAEILVIAVAHHARKPGYYRRRK